MDELEAAVTAAEDAIAALDAAVEAAGETADEALVARARKLRADPEKPEDAAAADDGTMTADEKKKDDEAVRGLRSTAATYGLTKLVDDLKGLGARSAEIRTALKTAVAARGAAPAALAADIKPAPQRSAPVAIDTAAIYARRNKR